MALTKLPPIVLYEMMLVKRDEFSLINALKRAGFIAGINNPAIMPTTKTLSAIRSVFDANDCAVCLLPS
jgi:hypothetical protein